MMRPRPLRRLLGQMKRLDSLFSTGHARPELMSAEYEVAFGMLNAQV